MENRDLRVLEGAALGATRTAWATFGDSAQETCSYHERGTKAWAHRRFNASNRSLYTDTVIKLEMFARKQGLSRPYRPKQLQRKRKRGKL